MRLGLVAALATILFGCDRREPAISGAEYAAFQESHPGMLQSCLDEVRFGGFLEWRPDDPACYEMLPTQKWSGLWEHGWEWTNFCSDPARKCNWMEERGTWLIFSDDVKLPPDMPDGIHRIEFIGRRTKVPGNFGHTASYEHLMIVDHIISFRPLNTTK